MDKSNLKYKDIITYKYLYNGYITHRKSIYSISNQTGIHSSVIYRRLKKYNIPTRTSSEAKIGISSPLKGIAKSDNPSYRVIIRKCVDCGKDLKGHHNDSKRCKSCAKKFSYINPINHPNWQDGKSFEPYSPEFNQQLKDKIRKRDNYICQNCNMTEAEHLIVFGQALHIHHIDYNKKDCKEDNLITVCHLCNTRANYNRKYWKKYYQEIMENE